MNQQVLEARANIAKEVLPVDGSALERAARQPEPAEKPRPKAR